MIVGRTQELARLQGFVRDTGTEPAAFVLEGEAGIGKTTLYAAALEDAASNGIQLLTARPAELDVELAFATLTDLLRPIIGDLASSLPEPQRKAIAVALLEETGAGAETDRRAVSAGVLSLLKLASEQQPVLLAIDDVQWVDTSSDRVLGFALRRLLGHPIRLLLSVRTFDSTTMPREIERATRTWAPETMVIGPLGVDDIASIVAEQVGERPARRETIEIHAESGGNPFFAVELARASRRGDDRPTGLSLPVPKGLRDDLVRHRFAKLSKASREALLVAAAASHPTVALLRTVLGEQLVTDALDAVEGTGTVRVVAGELRFAHPLYRSALYADASRAHRHRIHAAIADAVDDPEERGRHLALSAEVPDAAVADQIEQAATHARARGAPDTAAELVDHAIRLTPPGDVRALARRLQAEGEDRFEAGDAQGGIERTLRAADLADAGPDRASALASLGAMEHLAWRLTESRRHLEAALDEPGESEHLKCVIEAQLFWTVEMLGSSVDAARHAERAFELARAIDDRPIRARAYAAAERARFLRGGSAANPLVEGAPDLWGPIDGLPAHEWPRFILEQELLQLGAAGPGVVARLSEMLSWAEDRGDEPSRRMLLCELAWAERSGVHRSAGIAHARAASDVARHLNGAGREFAVLAWYEAVSGHLDEARREIERSLELIADVGNAHATIPALGVLTEVELMLGGPGEASEQLIDGLTPAPPLGHGAPAAWWSAAVETLIAKKRLGEAEPIPAWLRERAKTLDLPYMAGIAERCHGLILETRGELDAAEEAYERALDLFGTVAMPFEVARSSLELGGARRRSGHKRAARGSLQHAHSIFDELGAALWVSRVDDELGRITGRRPSMGELSDAERRVAQLAAGGARNREIAEQLYMSVRTVEGHLSHVYGKLGIRSRTELAVVLDDLDSGPPP